MKKVKIIRFNSFLCLILLLISVLLVACSSKTNIDNIEKFENKQVVLQGQVKDYLRFGSMNAYELKVGQQLLVVITEDLPEKGSTVEVSGIIYKDPLIGYELILDE